MKNLILIFLLALIIFPSCTKDDDTLNPNENDEDIPTCVNCDFNCLEENDSTVITNACFDDWECSFKVSPQSAVNLEEREGLGNGEKNVFQMISITQGAPNIADDEFTNILVFEIEESQTSFSIDDANLANSKVHFRRICYCVDGVEFKAPTSGCIQGERQSDGTWFVQGDLNIAYSFGDFDLKFDALFAN